MTYSCAMRAGARPRNGTDRFGWPIPDPAIATGAEAKEKLASAAHTFGPVVFCLEAAPLRILGARGAHVQWSAYVRQGIDLNYVLTLQSARWGSAAYRCNDPGYPAGCYPILCVPTELELAQRAVDAVYGQGGTWGQDTTCANVANLVGCIITESTFRVADVVLDTGAGDDSLVHRMVLAIYGEQGERTPRRSGIRGSTEWLLRRFLCAYSASKSIDASLATGQ